MLEGLSHSREPRPKIRVCCLCEGFGLPSGVVDEKEREFELEMEELP
jgi:hypothetical protein